MTARRIIFIAIVAFIAAVIGLYVGRAFLQQQSHTGDELHAVLHNDLQLDTAQERRLAVIERQIAEERRLLENQLRADNARLAEAIAAEHVYGPRVAAAVDASHHSMGALQKATLKHVFAMRSILRPDQQVRFDAAVDKALTDETR